MARTVFLCLAVLLLVASSSASLSRNIVYERTKVPPSWSMMGPADAEQMMEFNVALKQVNLDKLEDLFWSVSDPKSPMYANFMSIEEITELIAPPKRDHDKVLNWLLVNGVAKANVVSRGDALNVRAPVSVVEKLFKTKMHNFVNSKGLMIVRQMGAYSLPTEMLSLVDMVTGISDFPMPRPSPIKATSANANDANVVPQTLSKIYNIPAGTKVTNPESSVSVAEFQNDSSFLWTDMATFYQQTGITTNNVTHIIGPFSGADTEATLDIQYATAVGVGATNWYWTESNWMYDFSNQFFNTKEVPYVVSMSWGWSEIAQCNIDSDCSTLGINAQTYVTRVNTEFQKIGLRGVSLLASSGDSGANGRTDEYCQDAQLHPTFPAASPYVTAVGATQLNNPTTSLSNAPAVCQIDGPCASGGEEVAVSTTLAGFTSGGGFSVYASQPDFQKDAIAKFLNSSSKLPPSTYFNSQGRGYPDVAADGHNYLIYLNGEWSTVGGTSASSPCFAGIIALLNSERITKSGKPLGPLNTLLYQMAAENPAAFNDITSGDNVCTESGCSSGCKGFYAQPGWDPVTGLGSPNYVEMLKYVQSL